MEKLQVGSGDVLEFGPDGIFHPVLPEDLSGRGAVNESVEFPKSGKVQFMFNANRPLAEFLANKRADITANGFSLEGDNFFFFNKGWLEPGTRLKLL